MEKSLLKIQEQTLSLISKINSVDALKELEVKILGKKGELTILLKNLKDLSLEEKKIIGPKANKVRKILEGEILKCREAIVKKEFEKNLEKEWIDISVNRKEKKLGNLHPITKTQFDLEDIFMRLGFTVFDGNELDTEYQNFDALNIPDTHPARDMQDTFFVNLSNHIKEGKWVMRTHTSNLQNRVYKKFKPPFRVFIPGKVYRYESTDASHDMTFHQCEGVAIGEDISLGNLKHVMNKALNAIFEKEVEVRLRPGYFPFVEPGLELDMSCLLCEGKGCKVCKNTGWIEFMGCGMIHPKVLKEGGIDTEKYKGFAFGFGLTRLVMMKYNITDIREFFSGGERFVEQF